MRAYDHTKIEKRWQKEWAKKKVYKTEDVSDKPKYYILDMFPYPSGEGLHVGHPKGYIATDIVSRMKRMQGMNVLHPMGFDDDWSREVNTTDPKFYKWTQWIFLRLLEKGLAYQSFEPINWCPSCK